MPISANVICFSLDKKIKKIVKAIEKQIAYFPPIENIYLRPTDFAILLKSCSAETIKKNPSVLIYRKHKILETPA